MKSTVFALVLGAFTAAVFAEKRVQGLESCTPSQLASYTSQINYYYDHTFLDSDNNQHDCLEGYDSSDIYSVYRFYCDGCSRYECDVEAGELAVEDTWPVHESWCAECEWPTYPFHKSAVAPTWTIESGSIEKNCNSVRMIRASGESAFIVVVLATVGLFWALPILLIRTGLVADKYKDGLSAYYYIMHTAPHAADIVTDILFLGTSQMLDISYFYIGVTLVTLPNCIPYFLFVCRKGGVPRELFFKRPALWYAPDYLDR